MTWSYTGDPRATDRDAVRFLVGDTDTTDQLVTDEEIDYSVATSGSVGGAAVLILRTLAAKFARLADKQVGDLKLALSQRSEAFRLAGEEIEDDPSIPDIVAVPHASGIRISERDAADADTDRVKPSIEKGMHDFVSTSPERGRTWN